MRMFSSIGVIESLLLMKHKFDQVEEEKIFILTSDGFEVFYRGNI